MALLELADVLKLLEIQELPVEPKMVNRVVEWTNSLVQRNGLDWVKEHRKRLVAELEIM